MKRARDALAEVDEAVRETKRQRGEETQRFSLLPYLERFMDVLESIFTGEADASLTIANFTRADPATQLPPGERLVNCLWYKACLRQFTRPWPEPGDPPFMPPLVKLAAYLAPAGTPRSDVLYRASPMLDPVLLESEAAWRRVLAQSGSVAPSVLYKSVWDDSADFVRYGISPADARALALGHRRRMLWQNIYTACLGTVTYATTALWQALAQYDTTPDLPLRVRFANGPITGYDAVDQATRRLLEQVSWPRDAIAVDKWTRKNALVYWPGKPAMSDDAFYGLYVPSVRATEAEPGRGAILPVEDRPSISLSTVDYLRGRAPTKAYVDVTEEEFAIPFAKQAAIEILNRHRDDAVVGRVPIAGGNPGPVPLRLAGHPPFALLGIVNLSYRPEELPGPAEPFLAISGVSDEASQRFIINGFRIVYNQALAILNGVAITYMDVWRAGRQLTPRLAVPITMSPRPRFPSGLNRDRVLFLRSLFEPPITGLQARLERRYMYLATEIPADQEDESEKRVLDGWLEQGPHQLFHFMAYLGPGQGPVRGPKIFAAPAKPTILI